MKKRLGNVCSVLLMTIMSISQAGENNKNSEYVTVAILAKDKAHTLSLYLSCLERQTWPASNTYLYIRTNNNNDATAGVLREWVDRVGKRYAKIYFDDSDVDEPVQQFKQHEWNYTRFKVLGKIRQDSIEWAQKNNSHYFIADCDNFIYPDTLESMIKTNLPVVAPLLRCNAKPFYSNYHDALDSNGYYIPSVFYYDILDQKVKGMIEVLLVHCTYFIRHELLPMVKYDDDSGRYEYVIFSDVLRSHNIPQYIDNRKIYGYISFAETREEFEREPFLNTF